MGLKIRVHETDKSLTDRFVRSVESSAVTLLCSLGVNLQPSY